MISVDRIDAEIVADMLGIDVSAIPEDHETLTEALWDLVGLGSEPLPESVETRWEIIAVAIIGGGGYGMFHTDEGPT